MKPGLNTHLQAFKQVPMEALFCHIKKKQLTQSHDYGIKRIAIYVIMT